MKGVNEHSGIFNTDIEDEGGHTFRCDGCNTLLWRAGDKSHAEAEERATWSGWWLRDDGVHYCAQCVASRGFAPRIRIPVRLQVNLPDLSYLVREIPSWVCIDEDGLRVIAASASRSCTKEVYEEYFAGPLFATQKYNSQIAGFAKLVASILQIALPERK